MKICSSLVTQGFFVHPDPRNKFQAANKRKQKRKVRYDFYTSLVVVSSNLRVLFKHYQIGFSTLALIFNYLQFFVFNLMHVSFILRFIVFNKLCQNAKFFYVYRNYFHQVGA